MKAYLIFLLTLFLLTGCVSKNCPTEMWPEVTSQNKPWTRWWWMGSAVDSLNIEKLLKQYSDAGFGGVEITPIYGSVGFEDKYIEYLSPQWMRMLFHTVNSATNYGMQVDMNLGTGWPFGGPNITTDHSATRLILRKYEFKKGDITNLKIEPDDIRTQRGFYKLQALMAYGPDGEIMDLTEKVISDGTLNWQPESREWVLYAAFTARTMQLVKRAAPGGEGLTFDHFSRPALQTYLNRFENAFGRSNQGIRAFFNDSYEVYGTNWTDNFFDEFEKRRGYRLQEHIKELAEWPPFDETGRRVHCDYRETISDLLLENFAIPWTEWANKYKSYTRNQAHGSPGNLLDLYAAVDIPESETFGSGYFPIPGLRRDSAEIRNVDPDPFMLKFASSAANVSGKPLISCETFTWHGEHFKTSLAQCKPELEQVFLSGINHVFYHGTTYSPEEAGWPGWLFYASVNFNPSNSFWNHLNALNQYAARCQSILQTGVPDNELLVYWPLHDYWMTTPHNNLMLTIHHIDDWLHPYPFYKLSDSLSEAGYSFDFVSDRLLSNLRLEGKELVTTNSNSYKALIFPELTYLPEETLEIALKLAKKGFPVIFCNMPADIPGAYQVKERRTKMMDLTDEMKQKGSKIIINDDVPEALQSLGIYPEEITKFGLKFIRRKSGNDTWYFLVNHTSKSVDEFVKLNEGEDFLYLLDASSGRAGLAATKTIDGAKKVRIQLRPGESLFVKSTNTRHTAKPWEYRENHIVSIVIQGPWKVIFNSGGPYLPVGYSLDTPMPWTDTLDDTAKWFSGLATYSTTFLLNEVNNKNYWLELGNVYESARIKINGNEAGFAWSIPYKIEIGKWLKPGENLLEIEVANLMANRIRWMDQQGIAWRKFHEINFVNINYQPFNASEWEVMPSGLKGPVVLYQNAEIINQ